MSATGEIALRPDAGATLLETMVVVAIMALIGGLVFAKFKSSVARFRLEAARTELASSITYARASAVRSGRSQPLAVAADGAHVTAAARRETMPAHIQVAPAPTTVVFDPDGRPDSGHRFVLTDGRARLALNIGADDGLVSAPGGGR